MLLRFLAVLLCCEMVTSANADDIPRLPDGKVDVDAVISSFEAANPVIDGGNNTNAFTGRILGKSFQASYAQTDTPDLYLLSIRSSNLSEHAVYQTAVLLADLICFQENRSPAEVKWDETAVLDGQEWRVLLPCSTEPRLPIVSGGNS